MVPSEVHSPKSVANLNYGPPTTDYRTKNWRVLIEEGLTACAQMARDVDLSQDGRQRVRFFLWDPPAISLGWKQPRPGWLSQARWRASGVELVERPTGGGIAFHGSDVSVAIVIPRAGAISLEMVMRTVSQSAARLCQSYGVETSSLVDGQGAKRITYCLTQESPYALFIGTQKVAGFALRRYPGSWLVQGSVFVRPLPASVAHAIPSDVADQLKRRAVALSEAASSLVDERDVARRWAKHWTLWWKEALSLRAQGSGLGA